MTTAFSATGRDFEIAITAFAPTVALATVIGSLMYVPVMALLVRAATRLAPRLFGVKPTQRPLAAEATL